MEWNYITDVITREDYANIAHKFAGEKVTKKEVKKVLEASRPDVKEMLEDNYNVFIEILTDRIKEEPYVGEENACLFDEEEVE